MNDYISPRAEKLIDIFHAHLSKKELDELLRPCIAEVIQYAADRLCTDWGELQHPSDVLRDLANEVYNTREFRPENIFVVKTKFVNYVSLIDYSDYLIESAYADRSDAEAYIDTRIALFVYLWKNNHDRFEICMSKKPEEFQTEEEVLAFAQKHYRIEKVSFFK